MNIYCTCFILVYWTFTIISVTWQKKQTFVFCVFRYIRKLLCSMNNVWYEVLLYNGTTYINPHNSKYKLIYLLLFNSFLSSCQSAFHMFYKWSYKLLVSCLQWFMPYYILVNKIVIQYVGLLSSIFLSMTLFKHMYRLTNLKSCA